jgi:hypothetical protein
MLEMALLSNTSTLDHALNFALPLIIIRNVCISQFITFFLSLPTVGELTGADPRCEHIVAYTEC